MQGRRVGDFLINFNILLIVIPLFSGYYLTMDIFSSYKMAIVPWDVF